VTGMSSQHECRRSRTILRVNVLLKIQFFTCDKDEVMKTKSESLKVEETFYNMTFLSIYKNSSLKKKRSVKHYYEYFNSAFSKCFVS
jgi:hypothetical protein